MTRSRNSAVPTDPMQPTILIVDGAFLQREELRSNRDYLIWLKVDPETARAPA